MAPGVVQGEVAEVCCELVGLGVEQARLVYPGGQRPSLRCERSPATTSPPRCPPTAQPEVNATGGDIRQLCDLFGLSVTAATRYANTLDHPDLRS